MNPQRISESIRDSAAARERLADEIIQASPLMPDPRAHRHWLETQEVDL